MNAIATTKNSTASAPEFPANANIILCADDFAISDGVSRGIEELARSARLSATSAIVTLPEWESHGQRLAALRPHIAIGLHLNLTLGQPLTSVKSCAIDDQFPSHKRLLKQCLAGTINSNEVAEEISRQLDMFEKHAGYRPDFLDGHQHVHTLPVIRKALLQALQAYDPQCQIFIRDPYDTPAAITKRGTQVTKSLIIAGFATGFGARVRRAGYTTNRGFSGVSSFNEAHPFMNELAKFFRHPGPTHLTMCHPGYPDDALRSRDPVVQRRADELTAIRTAPGLDKAIWLPVRADDGAVNWPLQRIRS